VRTDPRQTWFLPRAEHGSFEYQVPGGEFLCHFSDKIRMIFTIVFEIVALIHAISHKQSPEKEILTALCVAHPVVLWLSPQTGVGGAGLCPFRRHSTMLSYIFILAHLIWTDNQHIKRLKALFTITFSERYRQDLVTDGTTNLIRER
jgi:hypothetical protein